MATISLEELKELLPQRFPFLLIDRVVDIDIEDKTILCYKNVSNNEEFFIGHFPNHPVMPGVLIIEAMAQAAGILGFKMTNEQRGSAVYYFAGANEVKFKHPVVPGDRLDLKATFVKERRNIWKFSCLAMVEGRLVSSADITCAKREF